MKYYTADSIRNVGIFGHAGEGKTTLAEAMLLMPDFWIVSARLKTEPPLPTLILKRSSAAAPST